MKPIVVLLILVLTSTATAQTSDWQAIEKLFGRKGTEKELMFKITLPRSDVKVSVGDFLIEPGLALTSWIAFVPMKGQMDMGGHHGQSNEVMIMGDMVLLDREVGPVIGKLMDNGLEVTALHN